MIEKRYVIILVEFLEFTLEILCTNVGKGRVIKCAKKSQNFTVIYDMSN